MAAGEAYHVDVLAPARDVPTPLLSIILTIFRAIYINLAPWSENMFFWRFFRGTKNPQAEIEGPYYVVGSPFREIEPGRAVLANKEQLGMKENQPFLFTGRVTAPDGTPIAGALIDMWQANTKSRYYLQNYLLRGKLHTDINGRFEVLTVAPGAYLTRAGHFHYIVTPPKGYEDLNPVTTQSYLCDENNTKGLDGDFANWFRRPRYQNTVNAWTLVPSPSDGKSVESHYKFPVVTSLDGETEEALKRWNKLLEAEGSGLKVEAGGHMDIKLTKKGRWL